MSEKDNNQNIDTTASSDNAKQTVRVTRSDPLSSTSQTSHSIKSKSRHHHHHPSGYTSHPTSYSNYCHSKEQRRARWIRERMSVNYKNQHSNNRYSSDNYYPIQNYHQSYHTNSSEDFDSSLYSGKDCWCGQGNQTQETNSSGGGGGSTWISENDSKANRFHRPYSLR